MEKDNDVLKDEVNEQNEVLKEETEEVLLSETEDELSEEEMLDEVVKAATAAATAAAAQMVTAAVQEAVQKTFDKRRVYRATDVERKLAAKNVTVIGKVISSSGEKPTTEADMLRKEYDILLNALRAERKKILYGTITGIATDPKSGQLSVLVKLDNTNQHFKIYIPVAELFPLNIEDFRPTKAEAPDEETRAAKTMEYIRKEMVARIGGHIGFIPYKLIESEKYCQATRLEAMQIEAYKYYIRKQNDGIPLLTEGMLAEAEVMSVRKDRVRVYVCGAETTIHTKELSWLSLENLTNEFKIGQKFIVKISNIKPVKHKASEKSYQLIQITASKRDAEKNPAEIYYDDFEIGEVHAGIIKNVNETGVFVNLLGKCDCLCGHPLMDIPLAGKHVAVQITMKKDAEKFIYGKIIHMS